MRSEEKIALRRKSHFFVASFEQRVFGIFIFGSCGRLRHRGGCVEKTDSRKSQAMRRGWLQETCLVELRTDFGVIQQTTDHSKTSYTTVHVFYS